MFYGKIYYFDWAIFNSYVSLPEGISFIFADILFFGEEMQYFKHNKPKEHRNTQWSTETMLFIISNTYSHKQSEQKKVSNLHSSVNL